MKIILVIAAALLLAGCITTNATITKDEGGDCLNPAHRSTSIQFIEGKLTTVITCRRPQ